MSAYIDSLLDVMREVKKEVSQWPDWMKICLGVRRVEKINEETTNEKHISQ
jgi:hypothetical protein